MRSTLNKHVVPFLVFIWLLLFSRLTHAQPVNTKDGISHGLATIPLDNLIIAAGLAFVGGLAWTAQKEAKSTVENKKPILTVGSDLFASVVTGVVTYFLMTTFTDSVMVQAAAITIAGYGGTVVLDVYVSALLGRIKDFFTPTPKS